MDFCTRPGGGSCGQRLMEVIRLQHEADDAMGRRQREMHGRSAPRLCGVMPEARV
jgi:hypothetical protein